MKKTLFTLTLALTANIICFSQNSTTNYWEDLLNNKRDQAFEKVTEAHKASPTIETLIAYEVLQDERGILKTNPNFLPSFLGQKDYENYLFALWNESYLFDNYLTVGFNTERHNRINKVLFNNLQNQSLKESMYYLKAAAERDKNNFADYRKYNQMMTSIRNWQYCGVFENLNSSGLDAIYEPESKAKSATDFNANSNGFVNWYVPKVEKYDGYMLFTNHAEYGSGVHYAQTFMTNPTERKAVIRVGTSAKFKLWLNDVLIYEQSKEIATDMDAYNVEVNLPKGINRLLVKVADKSTGVYMIVRVTDEKGIALNDIVYSDVYADYNASTLESINPKALTLSFEEYFIQKRKEDPTNFFYDYCLVKAYLRNEKYDEAKEVLMPLYAKYPQSSILRRLLIEAYLNEEDYTSMKELKENLERDDEDYFLSLTYKFQNTRELFRKSVGEMEEFLTKYANSTDSELLKVSAKTLMSLRREDKGALRKNLDDLVEMSLASGDYRLAKIYIPMYGSVLNNEVKSTKLMKQLDKKYFDYDVKYDLIEYYDSRNNSAKVIKIFNQLVKDLDNEVSPLFDLVDYLQYRRMYETSLASTNRILEIFPYSFRALEYKGDAYFGMDRLQEATDEYKKSLVFNSANSSIRRKIRDYKGEPDIVEEHKIQDMYQYIKDESDKVTVNNYGYNILLDEAIVELYKEAGGKGRYTVVFEVTDKTGIERLKEYSLGLYSGYTIIKSEIVKDDGSIVPAERSGSDLVFSNLQVGDAIYIDYQTDFNGYGRFYRDFINTYQFDGYHPCTKTAYTLIAPKGMDINYIVANGELDHEVKEENEYQIHKWTLNNSDAFPQVEDYMPESEDFAKVLHISTIKSWNDIANWYSDLVRSQMIINSEVEKVFKSLFPETDVTSIPEKERAERIYYYIAKNMTYSSVSFRQSGYVPQKPSKTITSKLGDCKDFSTLFVTLAKMAGLEANLVLVLTSDYGQKSLILPSQDFNHCIAKVKIDKQEQFLELTDKYLPFASMPNGLKGASILEIPYKTDGTQTYDLQKLENVARLRNIFENQVEIRVADNTQKLKIDTKLQGALKAYSSEVFERPNYDLIKKDMLERYRSSVNEKVAIDTVYNIVNDKESDFVSFTTEMNIEEKTNKIGAYKILKIPYVANAYTAGVISETDRKYPIEYRKYESTDEYRTTFTVLLNPGEEFMEVPEDVVLSFKNHSYTRKYIKVSPTELRIEVVAIPEIKNVSVEDYREFKTYVQSILDAKDQFIGYK